MYDVFVVRVEGEAVEAGVLGSGNMYRKDKLPKLK